MMMMMVVMMMMMNLAKIPVARQKREVNPE